MRGGVQWHSQNGSSAKIFDQFASHGVVVLDTHCTQLENLTQTIQTLYSRDRHMRKTILSTVTTPLLLILIILVLHPVQSQTCSESALLLPSSTATGGSRFRGNIFRISSSKGGYITQVKTGTQSGGLRVILQKSSDGTVSPPTWTGLYDQRVTVSSPEYTVFGVNIPVADGDVIMVGLYWEASRLYRYESYAPSLTAGLECVEWLSGVEDGLNAGVPTFFVPQSPSLATTTVYGASFIVESAPAATGTGTAGGAASCLLGTNLYSCSGYSCQLGVCQCPSGLSGGPFMESTTCSPLPSTTDRCSASTVLSVSSGSVGSVISNRIEESYLKNQECAWQIDPPSSNHQVTLSFVRFSTEPGFDTLQINSYDANAAVWRSWGDFSGVLPLGQAFEISLCGQLTLRFRSNAFVQSGGFYIGYTVSSTPSASCTQSGPRSLEDAIAVAPTTSSTSSSTSSSSSSSPSSSSSSSPEASASSTSDDGGSSDLLVLVLVLPGVFFVINLVLFSIYRAYRRRGAVDDDQPAEDRGTRTVSRRSGKKEGGKPAQARLSEWKRRNAVELGIDEEVSNSSSSYDTDPTTDDDGLPTYGQATSDHVRNRFLNIS